MTLADKIVVLQGGWIEQVGSPITLYQRPANLFVAQFIGSPKMNIADCSVDGAGVRFANGQTMATVLPARTVSNIGVRPEHITLVGTGEADISGVVDVVEQLGSDTFVYVDVDQVGLFTVRLAGHVEMAEGIETGLRFERQHLHLFDDQGLAVAAG
jgi:multiple sugar transport system ATP-binding protein